MSKNRNKRRKPSNLDRIWQHFDRDALRRICEMPEDQFASEFKLDVVQVAQASPANFYAFRDNDSDVLAVAHLDTVSAAFARSCNFVSTAAGEVVYSRALDDRLGAYIILELLPKLGINCDVLLTVGEESGQSTAAFFDAPKQYNWVIEFDRGGTDVVLYQFEDDDTEDLVEASGAKVGVGIFSDICYLEHLGVKAINWGVGYRDYHTARSHAYLDDTFDMVDRFMKFHRTNRDVYLPHYSVPAKGMFCRYDETTEEDAELMSWWADQLAAEEDAEAQDAADDAAWKQAWAGTTDIVLDETGTQLLG